jgi:hypothetical protein
MRNPQQEASCSAAERVAHLGANRCGRLVLGLSCRVHGQQEPGETNRKCRGKTKATPRGYPSLLHSDSACSNSSAAEMSASICAGTMCGCRPLRAWIEPGRFPHTPTGGPRCGGTDTPEIPGRRQPQRWLSLPWMAALIWVRIGAVSDRIEERSGLSRNRATPTPKQAPGQTRRHPDHASRHYSGGDQRHYLDPAHHHFLPCQETAKLRKRFSGCHSPATSHFGANRAKPAPRAVRWARGFNAWIAFRSAGGTNGVARDDE